MLYLTLLIGLTLIVITTKLTQNLKLASIWLLVGQISASFIIILFGNLEISHINQIELGYLSIPFSLLFLVGFTNVMNIEKEHKPLILLLPCISLVCLSISALIMGHSFVSMIGMCAVLTIMLVLLNGYISGKGKIGRTFTTSIGFVIAVLSLSLLKLSFVMIYIPIFTLTLPLALYLLLQNKLTSIQSIIISSLVALLFSSIMFVIPFNIVWYLVIVLTVILAISQLSSKHRFI
ncbi:UDP-N-acetylmuramyl pentapeptide phosphotransferase/UDP-N-acetylglucosamine-1-phosphate transferase [Lysinibacillus sphaericus]|uniref:UDP-N-acetylmuramyl pentapeptide phosphotransferase/UDP-N-acetylglucosamine-1-phosphate transferase n=1 Tax=Lysinibacillus sphaericus OT4b.31 TaxID=1285586 RepID=R7Z7U1_LYSSH|nr:UDP-N-acetylmuramyl pentapeptide phosphotransferase/UDP-N-acetylglucosamine-1-phosphate transferase [Lysinibacillus sphaericus]EON70217.1 UDP-N-acetylmuramyl pentapeptide phosphotransferase/UDP-N-acetylglucosamine-1-phosphate transferase [Lysinibacillus sphaericus OT4b.31]